MEDPSREIESVIRGLTQGDRQHQEDTLKTYFLPDAYFTHPFCRVPSFANQTHGPDKAMRPLDSRTFIQYIYQWYKILSPEIDITIDSAAFDQRAGILYTTIRQTFTIWIVPFNLWQANVKLVSVLELARHEKSRAGPTGPGGPSYAEVAAPEPTPALDGTEENKLWYIKGQTDHYQVDQWLRFISPFAPLWKLWQLFATLLCVLGCWVLWPLGLFFDEKKEVGQRRKEKEAKVKQ